MIREIFGQAVTGTRSAEAEAVLSHINRPGINLASVFLPPSARTLHYLRGLDAENRFIRAGAGRDSGYGRDVGYFMRDTSGFSAMAGTILPRMTGYDDFARDLDSRAALFGTVTGFDAVRVMIRVLPPTKDNLVWHFDNHTDKRGLQTLMGEMNTLWMPAAHVRPENLSVTVDEQGEVIGNSLHVPLEDVRQHARQVEHHHMSIHKGAQHPNPLYHTAPGYNEELGMKPGLRVLATFDKG